MVRLFLKNILFFVSPFFIYIIVAFYVDPFDVYNIEKNKGIQKREEVISLKLNYPLYKLSKFQHSTNSKTLLLGDSRVANMETQLFEKGLNAKASNLAYGGASLNEIIETFWFAADQKSLEKVFIGINFNLYNNYNSYSRVKEVVSLLNKKQEYFLSKYCIKGTFYVLYSWIFNKEIAVEVPPYSRNEFWQFQLENTTSRFYSQYAYPKKQYSELVKIAKYCESNDIALEFFIPPTHVSLQEKVKDFNLEKEAFRFKEDIKSLGRCLDFNFSNSLTVDKRNFKDPYHFTDSIGRIVVKELLLGKGKFSR